MQHPAVTEIGTTATEPLIEGLSLMDCVTSDKSRYPRRVNLTLIRQGWPWNNFGVFVAGGSSNLSYLSAV